MSFRNLLSGLAAIAFLAGCAGPVPDSNPEANGSFDEYRDFNTYRVQRDEELNGTDGGSGEITTTNLDDDTSQADGDAESGAVQTANVQLPSNNPNISDEQNFDAVSGRQTIESDAARLRALREARTEIKPTAVPTRTGSGGPNIVAFAVSTTNPVGEKIYRRNNVLAQSRFERNCAKYRSADDAQEAFLREGGPQRDSKGLDPDGDGFACSWDPRPFRKIHAARG